MQYIGPTFSEQWYRVAGLHPRLHAHVRLLRHTYRGEVWHLLDDRVSGRQHRINPVAWALVARLDGRCSVQEVWDTVVVDLGSEAPTQPEVLALLGQLHSNELITSEATPDLAGMFEQQQKRRRSQRWGRLNPMALRVALGNPTALLDRVSWLPKLLFNRVAAALWCLAMAVAVLAAASHGASLQAYAALHLGSPQQLLLMWLLFPLVKALHEAAHALAVRRWGGEVGEVGVTLMLLMPVPYVDASAATAFRERHRRVVVSLAGIGCELALAALGLWVWLLASDGLVRDAAFVVMLICSVSTLAFNGNPLVKMDAYHAMTDLLESPGLAPRSRAYWLYLARRWLLGLTSTRPPAVARGERPWLIGYGAASTVYQWLLAVWIVGWLLHEHLVLGLAAWAWFLVMMVLLPGRKLWRWTNTAAELSDRKPRVWALGGTLAVLPFLLLFALPIPSYTRADGVVWLPENALVRAQAEGFVLQVLVADGAHVQPGDALLVLTDPDLPAEEDSLLARERRLHSAQQSALFSQPASANALAEQVAQVQAELARLGQRRSALVLRAGAAGQVVLPRAADLPGRHFARGDVVAHVLPPQGSPVRVVVTQDDVSRLQHQAGPPEVRLAQNPGRRQPARLLAEVPAATHELPSPLLSDRHAGPFATDPADPKGLRTLQPVFTLDLALPASAQPRPGARAWVRFDHGMEPLAWQWLRRVRQLFIGALAGPAAPKPAPAPTQATPVK
ncbi:MAG: biotin/lipoyl-binding protein [Burkholderiaceae bacterium]